MSNIGAEMINRKKRAEPALSMDECSNHTHSYPLEAAVGKITILASCVLSKGVTGVK